MTDYLKIIPEEAYALVVGIEKYQLGWEYDIDGAVNDVINFTKWLLARGVIKENIYLFSSPLENNYDLLENFQQETNLISQPANRENISNAINDKLLKENVQGRLLYIFWGGHGIITKSQETRRRLFFSDTDTNNYRNLDFNSLQEALRTSGYGLGFSEQVYLIDACANIFYTEQEHSKIIRLEQAGERFSCNSQGISNQQFVLFASQEYGVAENQTGGGVFSQAVVEELNKLPKDCLLPDMKELTKTIEAKLEAQGRPKLVYKRFWNGSEEVLELPPRKIDWREVCREKLTEQRKLTTNFLTLHEGVTLKFDDVYVPLGLVERQKPSKRLDDISPESGSELYKETEITKTFELDAFLKEVIKQKNTPKSQGKRIAIIGEPGAGKTTLLQNIANWIYHKIPQSIVIWVSLADLQGRKLEDDYLFRDWLNAAVRMKGKAEVTDQIKDNFAAQFIQQDQVWLLLDGLDEMSVSSGNPLNEIARQIREGGSLNQARIVLTCRINLWDSSSYNNELYDFDIYRTLDFSYPQDVEKFINNWFNKIEDTDTGKQLCTALRRSDNKRIQDLIKNPLRLTLMCLIWRSGYGKLPDTQAGLYQQFVNHCYKWKKDKFAKIYDQCQQLNIKLEKLAKEAIDKETTRFRLRQDFVRYFLGDADDENSLLNLALKLVWLNQVGIDAESKPVYAFFHASFQEYFAAKAIDGWNFFLKHDAKNPSRGNYRIFEPQWKQTILLWLGREEESLKQQKQEFIDALATFKDESWKLDDFYKGFYEYRAYFLAAAGIGEFRDDSRADEIIAQIVKWGFGYFYNKKHEWISFPYPIEKEAKSALQQTDRKKAIAALIRLLHSDNVPSSIRWEVEKSLVKIGTGNEMAITALVQLLQSNDVDKDNYSNAAYSLGEIGTDNEMAIAALVKLLHSNDVLDETRSKAAKSLGKIGNCNKDAIAALLQLLVLPDVPEYIRQQAAESLGKIGTGNDFAITALMKLMQLTTLDTNTRRQAAECLGKIGIGNKDVIATLVQLLQSPDVDSFTRWQVAESLGRIDIGNEDAIAALEELLELTTVNYYNRRKLAESLGTTHPGNKKAITALMELLPSIFVDTDTRRKTAESLGKIGIGNVFLITKLVDLLQSTTVDESTRWQIAEILGKIGANNEMAISALVKLLPSPDLDELTRREVVKSLGKIGINNEMAISALVKLLPSPDLDELTRREVVENLGTIGTGNKDAISALVQLLSSNNVDTSTRGQAAESLGKIGTGNKDAISALVQLLQSNNLDYADYDTCKHAISSLGKICVSNKEAISVLVQLLQSNNLDYITRMFVASSLSKILHNNHNRFEVVNVLSGYQRFDGNCYDVLWECSQNMSYPDFYQAWHDHNIVTLAMRNLKKILFTRLI